MLNWIFKKKQASIEPIIGEPTSLIIEALKDVSRWEVVAYTMASYKQAVTLKDLSTEREFSATRFIPTYGAPTKWKSSLPVCTDVESLVLGKALVECFNTLSDAKKTKEHAELTLDLMKEYGGC